MTTELTQKLENIISGHSINEDAADWLRALTTSQPAQAGEVQQRLFQLLNGAAGDGLIINDIDAAELFTDLFPEHIEFITRGGVGPTQPAAQATPEPIMALGESLSSEQLDELWGRYPEVRRFLIDKLSAKATPGPVGEAWGWAVNSTLFRGEFAEADAKAEAKRCGGTTRAVALYTRPAPGVPEGFALVPVNPTPEMISAAQKVGPAGALRAAWSRMLAAAQAKGGV